MKVYLDTGVFIDYLISRGHAGIFLRKSSRRNRSLQQLSIDVLECFNKIKGSHVGITSSLTLFEVEEVMYQELSKTSTGIENRKFFVISSSRPLIIQILVISKLYDIQILDLTQNIIQETVAQIELQYKGIRVADSLHMLTAIRNNAELIITTDADLLNLDEIFKNQNGVDIRCKDTDQAKLIL